MALPNPRGMSEAESGGLVDIDAVAARLGVQVRHVRRLVFERRIPFLKWGHLLRFDPAEIEGWLDTARQPAEDDHETRTSSPLKSSLGGAQSSGDPRYTSRARRRGNRNDGPRP
jgi:excisionase family DNA binding protein